MNHIHSKYLILGAGPAGLQLGYCLSRNGRDYLILDRAEAGAFYSRFPRHRTLISSNKTRTGYTDPEINLRFDWNSLLTDDHGLLFGSYTRRYFAPADTMVRYLRDFATHYALRVQGNTEICQVTRERSGFRLQDTQGNTYSCEVLVAATGNSRPYLPHIEGIELADTYVDVSVKPEDFDNQRVLIIGKGNSAFETAENLVETAAIIHVASPSPLKLAWQTHYPGHLRAVNNNFLDTYQLKTQNAVLDATIQRIRRTEDGKLGVHFQYTHADGEQEELVYDRVIVCTGFRFDADIFDADCRPALVINDRFPEQTSSWESVNVPNLFFAGAPTQMRDFKRTNSAFIHGFRYNSRALAWLLQNRYERTPLPSTAVPVTTEGLLGAMLETFNRSSALWQQFGFMGSALVLGSKRQEPATHYAELPVDFIHESGLAGAAPYFVATLEFGKAKAMDPFHHPRHPTTQQAHESLFLHPVVRAFSGGQEVGEHHLLENLFGEWKDEKLHIAPLRAFIHAQLQAMGHGSVAA
ncbi:NAD(P)-binding domain-containing protein [Hyalangium rubrum]|uniref:NAD(P)-binding domain-containing protein n=1 Tax=Hyalangium rubrum TaxID=3103134 RepID=A0ABU5GXL8_9BACT|nr:NAD(P)-binding domain-containing protein [Hyalangium sp. s54d21]MDY7225836.1 NAD(P)-binding domain-containing protein [Hyalangium sp. s54d21]